MLAQRCPICYLKENYQRILPSYTGCGARGAQQAGSLRDDVLMDASYFNGQYCSISIFGSIVAKQTTASCSALLLFLLLLLLSLDAYVLPL